MDVHPPLAKMLYALFGYAAGFRGDFDFAEIGKYVPRRCKGGETNCSRDYSEANVPYVAMRLYPALLGVLTIPISYFTFRVAGGSIAGGIMAAAMVMFDNALVTQSRLILLDSPLVFATAMTTLCYKAFETRRAFTKWWWLWLGLTGFFLGATLSIKWVGLFTFAYIGLQVVYNLWNLLGDITNPMPVVYKHFSARAAYLLFLPLAFYVAMFAINFVCLVNPGDGDGFMSPEFQSTLNHKGMDDVNADVAYGSMITLRHYNTHGGYLHSHNHAYPGGSNQQQVTLYPHADENNVWQLQNETDFSYYEVDPQFIYDGSIIRLDHWPTRRRLHTHDVRPPVTEAEFQNEVSAYGFEGFEGDANDWFRVEIVKDKSKPGVAQERVRAVDTKFRLVHPLQGCALFSHPVKLPDWGYGQQEVTCAKGGTIPNSIWYIEANDHKMLGPDADKVNYARPGFFSKFLELNHVMWDTNKNLLDSHVYQSRPGSWPLLTRGINFWVKNHRQIYLLGNPFVWWGSTVAVALYLATKAASILAWQRGFQVYERDDVRQYHYQVGTNVLGWLLHYLPFFLMKRQLFLHHYLPALYFAILAFAHMLDLVALRVLKKNSRVLGFALLVVSMVVFGFSLLSPLAYGDPWTQGKCNSAKLLPRWDFTCDNFFKTYEEYSSFHAVPQPSATSATSQAAPVVNDADELLAQNKVTSKESATQAATSFQKIEYRDEHGNKLDPELVKQLDEQGQVEFVTQYETWAVPPNEADGVLKSIQEQERLEREREIEAPVHGTIADGQDPSTDL